MATKDKIAKIYKSLHNVFSKDTQPSMVWDITFDKGAAATARMARVRSKLTVSSRSTGSVTILVTV